MSLTNSNRRSFLLSSTKSSIRPSQNKYSLLPNSQVGSVSTNIPGIGGSSNNGNINSNGNSNGNSNNRQTSMYSNTLQQGSRRDPRPLRDRNFQNMVTQEILEYLNSENFSIDTNYAISLKQLKQPTQRDFVTIFKWCYLRLDPGYQFLKSIENEVYHILKMIQYPYLETINKSQISAVGGTNWPKFLGMLHWLIKINKSLDLNLVNIDNNISNQNTQDLTILTNHTDDYMMNVEKQELKQEKYELMLERLFIDYLIQSYKNFLQLNDDYSVFYQNLEKNFSKFKNIIITDISIIDEKNIEFNSRFKEYMESFTKLDDLIRQRAIIEDDYGKLSKYIELMNLKKTEWIVKLGDINAEIELKNKSITTLKSDIENYQRDLDSKGFSIVDINNKMDSQTKITNDLKNINKKADLLKNTNNKSLMQQFTSLSDSLLQLVNQYNYTIDSLSMARRGASTSTSTSTSGDGMEELKIDMQNIQQDTIQNIKVNLNALNREIQENIVKYSTENDALENKIEELRMDIENKSVKIESLENSYSNTKNQVEIEKQQYQFHILQQEIEIEKLENKIMLLNQKSNDYLVEIESKINSTKTQYQTLKQELGEKERQTVQDVVKITSSINKFKETMRQSVLATKTELDKLGI